VRERLGSEPDEALPATSARRPKPPGLVGSVGPDAVEHDGAMAKAGLAVREFGACAARRCRDEAEHEMRTLARRAARRTPPRKPDGERAEALTDASSKSRGKLNVSSAPRSPEPWSAPVASPERPAARY
jgi:hypothetical protein